MDRALDFYSTAVWARNISFFPQTPGVTERTATVMAVKFISGYLTEYSLSVDNLFVFILIFSVMVISPQNQPKLLKLGILIAIVLRILFILIGMELVMRFHWILYIMGLVLIYTGGKMLFTKDGDTMDPKNNAIYKAAKKVTVDIAHNDTIDQP